MGRMGPKKDSTAVRECGDGCKRNYGGESGAGKSEAHCAAGKTRRTLVAREGRVGRKPIARHPSLEAGLDARWARYCVLGEAGSSVILRRGSGSNSSAEVVKDISVTRLLQRWQEGERQAADELMPLVYDELRRLARRQMRRERVDLSLQATGLVHEAYVRLVDAEVAWQDRVHFFALAARAMRRVLVDRARARGRAKRGGGVTMVTWDERQRGVTNRGFDLLDLNETLQRLEAVDRRKCEVIELHFFGGLTYEEMAGALKVSEATVHRELRFAKAWLYKELRQRERA